jgi:hypothetical protein
MAKIADAQADADQEPDSQSELRKATHPTDARAPPSLPLDPKPMKLTPLLRLWTDSRQPR